MIDSNSQFYAILTNVGVAKQANANVLGIAWKITQMGVGDANDTDPQPSATQKTLINEWRRAPLNQLIQDATNPAIIIAEQVIPAEIGGKWIREIGLYDADGDLVAVANCAPSFKPLLAQGSGRTQVVRMNLIVSNSASVELKIDPSVVLATREFVTSELAKQDFKSSVLVCTTGNIALTGLQTIDGVAVTAGKRVLVAKQTAAKDNGIWVAAAGAWARAADADKSEKVTPGLLVHVEQGTLYGDSGWQLVTDGALSLGVTALSFEMAWGRTGVTAGTYRSVTVDKYGRVVAATNPTTVAGYGLTDVYTMAQLDAALLQKADLNSPVLIGAPKAPTAPPGTSTQQLANTAFVQTALAALVNSSPAALDTLNELALALGNDPNFATSMANLLAAKAPLASPALTGTPTTSTPATNAAGQQIASLDYVRAWARKFTGVGVGIPGATYTVTAAQVGSWFNMTSPGAVVTLPPAGTLADGATFLFRNSAGNNSVSLTSTSNIATDVSSTTLVLEPYEIVELAASGTTYYVVGRGYTQGSAPLINKMITGVLTKDVSGGSNVTLTAAEAAYGVLWFSGTLTANISVIVPTGQAGWSVFNRTAGNFTLTVKTAAGVGQVVRQGCQSQLMCGGTNIYFSQSGFDEAHFAKEIQSTSVNALRHVQGNYGYFWRNDGANLYLMLTDSGDQYGNYNARRPFSVNFATGKVKLDDGVTMPTMPLGTNTTDGANCAFVLAAIADLIGSAPNTLNTLNELAVALGNDSNFAGTMATLLGQKAPLASPLLTGDPRAPTAAVGDSDLSIANTAFVQTAINNNVRRFLGNVVGIAASVTLTPAQTGGAFNINAAGVTITLPAAVDAGAGQSYLIRNGQSKPATVAAPGAAIIYTNYDANSSQLVLAPWEWVEIQATTTNYFVNTRGKLGEVALNDSPVLTGDPRAPTPAVGDNDKSIANTEFVQLALAAYGLAPKSQTVNDLDALRGTQFFRFGSTATGALPGSGYDAVGFQIEGQGQRTQFGVAAGGLLYIRTDDTDDASAFADWVPQASQDYVAQQITANTRRYTGFGVGASASLTLTAAHLGNWINATLAGMTITLPASSNLAAGQIYQIRNQSAGTVNITHSGGTIQQEAGVSSGTLILAKNEWVELAVNGASYWVTGRGKTEEVVTFAQLGDRVGEVTHFAMSTPPAGYLKRNGAAVSRTTYSALFAKIGTLYGAGDGSTTFNVPDSRAVFDRGWDDSRGVDTGRALGSDQESGNLFHTHGATTTTGGAHTHTTTVPRELVSGDVGANFNAVLGDTAQDGTNVLNSSSHAGHTHAVTVNSSGGSESRPFNTAFLACIKY